MGIATGNGVIPMIPISYLGLPAYYIIPVIICFILIALMYRDEG